MQCRDAILTTPFKGVELIPSSMALAAAELELADMRDRVMRLKEDWYGSKESMTLYSLTVRRRWVW